MNTVPIDYFELMEKFKVLKEQHKNRMADKKFISDTLDRLVRKMTQAERIINDIQKRNDEAGKIG